MSWTLEPYNVLLFVAIHVAVFLTERRLRQDGESLIDKPWLIGLVLLAGLAGGRAHYIVEGLARGTLAAGDLGSLLSPLRGGSTFFGSMGGVIIALLLMRRRLPHGSFLRLADASVAGLGVAIAVGRVGCLLNGCCLGTVTDLPWAQAAGAHAHDPAVAAALARMHAASPGGDVGLHPLVIYLGIWSLGAAWIATRARVRTWFGVAPGTRFFLFALLFAAGRFLLEGLRLPPGGEVPTANAARWESLIIVVALTVTLAVRRREAGATDLGGR